ncbi:hypothetical protein ASA1KI_00070 [Opitutales bacterium ASA1]|uniref:hypothetical protein n=1 Tax=Congregicoccus parvus TaxID=3081749 RepID=UPI002B324436|nr:hypothetical protein ASA1KI_00070 [Opitutales bacterium ASA1]
MANRGGESERHRELKRRALVWARANGFALCATEVRIPRSGFRADVAACARVGHGSAACGETAIFECKQARADLLRDTAVETRARARLKDVVARRRDLEAALGVHLPDLRRGESLFPEYDGIRDEEVRHEGLRALVREERTLRGKLFAGTKFDRLRRYGCADRHYLVVHAGVLAPHEGPPGWGVLEAEGEEGLATSVLPARLETHASVRLALLQAVASVGTRLCDAQFGIDAETLARARATSVSHR